MKPLLKIEKQREAIASEIAKKISASGGGRFIGIFCNNSDVFFSLEPGRGVLIDSRKPIIAFYEAVQREPDAVHDELQKLKELGLSKDSFNSVRSQWNGKDFGVVFAAKFLYLNALSVSGSFSVDVGQRFSASWGGHLDYEFPSADDLKNASTILKRVRLYTKDYSYILRAARKGDVVYADVPSWGNETSYNGAVFSSSEHLRISKLLKKASDRGVVVFASNIDCDPVRSMYEYWADTEDVNGYLMVHAAGSYMQRNQMSLF